MITVKNSFYKDYEDLLIKNDKLSEENRKLRYSQKLVENQNKTLRESEQKVKEELLKQEELLKEKVYEIILEKGLENGYNSRSILNEIL